MWSLFACSFMFTFLFSYWWAIVYSPDSALCCVVVSFICITTSPSIFMLLFFFSFLLLLFFLLFKQIKRFLLNMQAIVSSPSPWLHSASYCLCVCVCLSVCVLVHTVSPNICVRTWRWMRATAFCVELVYPRFVVVSDRVHWRRASPSCLACLWVLLSCLVWHVD